MHLDKKSICLATVGAFFDPKKPVKSPRQGDYGSEWPKLVCWSFHLVQFETQRLKSGENGAKNNLGHSPLNSTRRTTPTGSLGSAVALTVSWQMNTPFAY